MSFTIENWEIAQRLQFLGYGKDLKDIQSSSDYPGSGSQIWPIRDQLAIEYSKKRGLNEIAHYLNRSRANLLKDFGSDVKESFLDIICSHFLEAKRDIGINSDGSISATPNATGDIKSIQEDALKIEYETDSSGGGGGTTEDGKYLSPFDEMIQYLKKEAYQSLQSYRYIYPYHRWISFQDKDQTEEEEN